MHNINDKTIVHKFVICVPSNMSVSHGYSYDCEWHYHRPLFNESSREVIIKHALWSLCRTVISWKILIMLLLTKSSTMLHSCSWLHFICPHHAAAAKIQKDSLQRETFLCTRGLGESEIWTMKMTTHRVLSIILQSYHIDYCNASAHWAGPSLYVHFLLRVPRQFVSAVCASWCQLVSISATLD